MKRLLWIQIAVCFCALSLGLVFACGPTNIPLHGVELDASADHRLGGYQPWGVPTATPPGGSNTQVQYNSSGAFAGSANMAFDGTSINLISSVGSTNFGAASTQASTGRVRAQNAESVVVARNAANSADIVLSSTNSSNEAFFGSNNTGGGGLAVNSYLNASTKSQLAVNGSVSFFADANGASLPSAYSFNLIGAGTQTLAGGAGVMYWGPANTVPTSNPTNGDVLFADTGTAGHVRARDANGVVTDLQHGQINKTIAGNTTLTSSEFASQIITFNGSVTASVTCPGPSNDAFGTFRIFVSTSVNTNITITSTTGAGTVAIPVNKTQIVRFDSGGAKAVTAAL